MQKFKKLYEKLWKSLIQPHRLSYQEEDLRPTNFNSENGELFRRFDRQVVTKAGHTLKASIWLPVNDQQIVSTVFNNIFD